ncbi:MAG: CocE/NonD family hydrolase [Actinomycetota bacterium]
MSTLAVAAVALLLPGPARADSVSSVLGIPCTTQADGVQACIGDTGHRVKTWDGVPLDVNIWLPPANQQGPFPLVVYHHGYGFSKDFASPNLSLAQRGYAVMAYTARGFGNSCGAIASRLADPQGCAQGWIHLDDVRFEARDTQHLAGLLADLGLVRPRRIGVTGTSYGGGVSFLLAALRQRMVLPGGRIVRWRSPQGRKMRIAAAAPLWGWSDLSYALMPNGHTLDYLVKNPYGPRIGVAKESYMGLLYTLGVTTGFYAPPGADQNADITNWFARLQQGEPYEDANAHNILFQIQRFHSAYYLQDGIRKKRRRRPAPILAYNSWIDDLFPGDELLRYRNYVLAAWPDAEFSLLLAAGAGHPRATIFGETPGLEVQLQKFFDRHLRGARGKPLGVQTYTQPCGGQPLRGPYTTRTWAKQHPGEVRLVSPAPHSFSGGGGDPAIAGALDPLSAASQNGCVTTGGAEEANSATYGVAPAGGGVYTEGSGYTLIGSPTVIARVFTTDLQAQVVARLWDLGPDGNQVFVTRGVLRPDLGRDGRQPFQLNPNGWFFAPGHVAKLELLGRDSPYARASNGSFGVSVSDLELRLPVRERPNGGQILDPAAPVRRDGLAFGPCTNPRTGTDAGERIVGTNAGDLQFGLGGEDTLLGRRGIDCQQGGPGGDLLRGGPKLDVLLGGGDNDTIGGGQGPDAMAGLGGRDTIRGGAGADRIFSRDGRRDIVRCGKGRDAVAVDGLDAVYGCEAVSFVRATDPAQRSSGGGELGRFFGRRYAAPLAQIALWSR